MEDYKPNSHRFKEEQKQLEKKKVEKVISGDVKVRKKGEAGTFKSLFISEDAANIKSFVLMDVLIPACKKAVSDIVTNGIDMILYGEKGGNRKRSASDRVTYSRFYDPRERERDRRYIESRNSRGFEYEDFTFANRGDAERVLSEMDALLDRYKLVSVSDFNDLIGVSGEYTDNRYGWTSLNTAKVVRVRDGYIIELPKAIPIG